MEASEKLTHTDETTVRAIGNRLVIERLEIDDERSARVVRERAEVGTPSEATVRDAIEIGARVLEREGTAAEVDYVQKEFERTAGELRERLTRTLEAGDEQLAEQIAKTFDGSQDESVQRQIEKLLSDALEGQRSKMVAMFTAEDAANPLSDFKGSVVGAVNELRADHKREQEQSRERIEKLTREFIELKGRTGADERVAEAEQAGTRKGFTFEERVDVAIERIANGRDDAASHTGASSAEGGGKKGDTLVELGAARGPALGRIVFEAKDKKLSKNDAWKELNDSMAARAAGFGVLVVAGEERIPAGREALTEYEGNKLIVAVDREQPDGLALEVAYRLAAARVTMARDDDLTVDAVAVRDASQEALSCLKQAQAIKAGLTGIKTSSDKARAALDEMVESVRARLMQIEALVEITEPD